MKVKHNKEFVKYNSKLTARKEKSKETIAKIFILSQKL